MLNDKEIYHALGLWIYIFKSKTNFPDTIVQPDGHIPVNMAPRNKIQIKIDILKWLLYSVIGLW